MPLTQWATPATQTVAGLTNTMLHANATKLIEPIKKNQYRLLLQITNLISGLQTQFNNDSAYLQTIKSAMTGNVYPIEISFIPPAIQVEQRKIRGKGNVEVKYAGYVSYGNSEATFHNFIDLDTYKFFYRWASLAGALDLQRNGDNLLGAVPASLPLAVPDFAADAYGGYKVNATVSTYHTLDTSAGDATENNRWILQGVFPTQVSAGDLNHADDGEPILTNVSFSVDLALPASPSSSSR
jgi:hypothetical protein